MYLFQQANKPSNINQFQFQYKLNKKKSKSMFDFTSK